MNYSPGFAACPRKAVAMAPGGAAARTREAVPGSHLNIIWTARGEQRVGNVLLQDVICIRFIEDRISGVECILTVALSADDEVRVKSALETGSHRFYLR